MRRVLIACAAAAGCKVPAEADEPFNDALVTAYRSFDAEPDVLAPVLRNLERQLYATLQIDGRNVNLRSILPSRLVEADVAHLAPRPADVDPADALAVATGYASGFPVEAHAVLPTQPDQRPLEPQSPDHYDREFLQGERCWTPRDCEWLRTRQDLTKVYGALSALLPPITYAFHKDFRWVDMAADDAEEPRWAFIARSWNDDSFSSENGKNVIFQSYTLELWLPRDGRGFLWDDVEFTRPEGEFGDSSSGGTLRLNSLWTQTVVPLAGDDEDLQAGTIKLGMNDNFQTHERWLEDNWER